MYSSNWAKELFFTQNIVMMKIYLISSQDFFMLVGTLVIPNVLEERKYVQKIFLETVHILSNQPGWLKQDIAIISIKGARNFLKGLPIYG